MKRINLRLGNTLTKFLALKEGEQLLFISHGPLATARREREPNWSMFFMKSFETGPFLDSTG